ncbi:MAG: uncharacterized protein KVP18_001142 [Porospora cf. gigantea A]|nr:MAG: hypothetical protein KVP18_001142 [Porospora cf. gigantea A]
MTSSRSVPWLEEARWFTIDVLRECSSLTLEQAVDVVFADMCILLVLLETSPSPNADCLRWYVVCLAFLHLGQAYASDVKFQTMHTLLAFQAVRCVALGHSSIGHVQRLMLCFDKSSDEILSGWDRFAIALNLPPDVIILAVDESFFRKTSLVNSNLWPLFLNPIMLRGERWSDVKDRIPFKGYDLHPSIANSRFPSRMKFFCDVKTEVPKELVGRLIMLASCQAAPTTVPLGEPVTKSPVFQGFSPISLAQLAPDQRHDAVQRLGTIRQAVTRHPGCHSLLPTGVWFEPLLELVRQKLALHVSEAMTAGDFTEGIQLTKDAFSEFHEKDTPVTHPNRWLMVANVMCFCQHGCHNEQLRIWFASLMTLWIRGCPKDPHLFTARLEQCLALMDEPMDPVKEFLNYKSVPSVDPVDDFLNCKSVPSRSGRPSNYISAHRMERLLARMRLKLATTSTDKRQKWPPPSDVPQEIAAKNTTPVKAARAAKNTTPVTTAPAVAKPRHETCHIRKKRRDTMPMLPTMPVEFPITPLCKLLSLGHIRTQAVSEEASTVLVGNVEIGSVDVHLLHV